MFIIARILQKKKISNGILEVKIKMKNNIYKRLQEINGNIWDILTENSEGDCQIAKIKERFDFFIKKSFLDGNPYLPSLSGCEANSFGFYNTTFKRFYDRYFSESFGLKNKLDSYIQKAYDEGQGNEFTTGKFYSVASSSRFAVSNFSYNCNDVIKVIDSIKINGVKKNVNIEFEKELNVFAQDKSKISKPQMDVFLAGEEKYFVEVKCHEILDSHKNIELKWRYTECPDFEQLPIKKELLEKKRITNSKGNEEEYITISGNLLTAKDFGCELKTFHFDFKQFLCHLLGILNESKGEKVHFYYLFYKNELFIENEGTRLYEDLEAELKNIFSVFSDLFPTIEFGFMYNDKFDTLSEIRNNFSC